MDKMAVTVKVTDGWMVKALAKQIHTMKWNGRAPGVIVQREREGAATRLQRALLGVTDALDRIYKGEERRML